MSGVIRLNTRWLKDLSAKNKGELGEAIVETHLRSALTSTPERFFESIEVDSNETFNVYRSSVTSYNLISGNVDMEPDTWTPDISLVVEPYSSVWEPRIVLTEVKTGQYAELKDNQKQVMGAINNRLDTLVLRASVTLDSEEFAEIQYSTVESDADTKTGHRLSPISLSP